MPKDLPNQFSTELTEREQEILRLLATGTSNKEIARDLFISSNTVKVHLRNIFAKIGVASRTEAAMYAVQVGLVKSPAASGQEDGSTTVEGSLPVPVPITASEATPKPRFGVRLAGIVAIMTILVVAVDMGILLTRPKATPTASPIQATPTVESRWKILAALPIPRDGLGVSAYGNQIYAIGGENGQMVTGLVERYDPTTNSWAELSKKPVPVTDVNAEVIGGKIYLAGGRLASGEVTNILEVYDPQVDRWVRGAPIPASLSAYAEVAFEGKLYLFGGWDGKHFLATVYEYDPDQDTWRARAPMPTARGFAGAAVVEGKIFVVGGFNGTNALSVSEVYFPERDQGTETPWDKATSLPEGRYAMGIASLTDTIYVVGGKGEPNTSLPPVFNNPQTNSWEKFEVPSPRIGDSLGLISIGNYLYVVGGRIGQETTNYTLAYQAIYSVQFPVVH